MKTADFIATKGFIFFVTKLEFVPTTRKFLRIAWVPIRIIFCIILIYGDVQCVVDETMEFKFSIFGCTSMKSVAVVLRLRLCLNGNGIDLHRLWYITIL